LFVKIEKAESEFTVEEREEMESRETVSTGWSEQREKNRGGRPAVGQEYGRERLGTQQ